MASAFDIAVVGMAGRFPGARSVDEFWRNLAAGVESIAFFTDEEVIAAGVDPALARDPRYVKAGGVLDDVEWFDAAFFGYTPREAEVMDPQQRVFLECAWEAIEHAGYDTERYRKPIGVYAGMSMNTYVLSNLIFNPAAVEAIGAAQAAISNLHDHLATRVSYKLDLRGPSFTVQTACSTSLVAAHLACQALLGGECDMALAGGVSIGVPQKAGYLYDEGGTHSPDGHCRAFDAKAQGMIGGCGVGVVVLKRLEDAVADGDRVVAVVKGTAVNNDGASKVGYTAPSVDGQARVIRAALRVADVPPGSIGYIEAHGTGTPIGDPIEFEALTRVFKPGVAAAGSCGLGSVKTNVGHLDAAAGVTGLIKTILALEHGQLPPSLHFERPNPRIDFASSPFFVVDRLREWTAKPGVPRRAGVSAFGIGGTNAHVVLEEAPAAAAAVDGDEAQIYVLSARTPTALDAARGRLASHLDAHTELASGDIAWTLQAGRRAFPHRLAVVARSRAEAAASLASGKGTIAGAEPVARQTAFLFPGQGAQHPGMARALYERFPAYRAAFDQCADAMRSTLDVDLVDLVLGADPGGDDRLRRTEYTQPALFAVEYALARLTTSAGVAPAAYLGHSVGEYVAACLAGVFSLDDAAALVALRGRLMSRAPGGAMLAVLLPEDDARALAGDGLSIAAINGPKASVLAGDADAIARLERTLDARGVGHTRLRTSHAFHSHLMDGVVGPFTEAVARCRLSPPSIPFVSNVTGTWIDLSQATDPGYWARHLREPVRFADGVAALAATCTRLVEVGPGAGLTALARQTLRARDVSLVTTLPRADAREAADETWLAAIARLWTERVEIDWRRLHDGVRRTRVPLPSYPFERQRYWIDPVDRQPGGLRGRAAHHGVRFYAPSWTRDPRKPRVPAAASATRRWLLLADAHGLGDAAAERLAALGHDVAGLTGSAVPADAAGCDALVARLRREGRVPDAIVHLLAASPIESASGGDLLAARPRAFDSLVWLAQALGRQGVFSPMRLEIVSANLHDVLGSEPLAPAGALLVGPLRVIPQESPNIRTRNVDLSWSGADAVGVLADRLVVELTLETDAQMVALRGDTRWTPSFEPIDLLRAPVAAARRGAGMVFGGLGNIGRVAARALAQSGTSRIALVGRRADPDGSIVAELEALGAEVMLLQADIEDPAAVRSVFARARERFGPITAVVHAAGPSGASAVAAIADIDQAHVAAQFGAKVRGLEALATAVADDPPDVVMLASSLSSVLGGLGFGAYASANAVMDAVATAKSRTGRTRWIAVDWDGWRFDAPGAPGGPGSPGSPGSDDAIDAAGGLAAFSALLDRDAGPRVVASASDLEPRLARWINPGSREETTTPAAAAARTPRSTPVVAPTNDVERLVVSAWQELLGVDDIGIDDSFFELGGHSLLATQLVSRLRRALLIDVPLRVIFDRPTVRDMALAIVAHEPAPGQAAAAARLRLQLSRMTPDELKAMMAARQTPAAGGRE